MRKVLAFALSLALAGSGSAISAPPSGEERAPQTIRVRPVRSPTFLDPDFEIDATATSGLPVQFTASGDCSVDGATVRLLSAGRCVLTASQPGDSQFQAAPEVKIPLSIGKAEQRIDFPPPPARTYLDPDFELDVTASSGLPVVLVASGDCEVDGSTVHILGAGTCSVSARQPGDRDFTAARIVDVRFPIARAEQAIDFRLNGVFYRGTSVALSASATSRLPVRFEAYGSCAVVGTVLNLLAEGICTVNADQLGNRNFSAAPTVTKSATVLSNQ